MTDKANISNETKRSRANTESFGLPNAVGLENSKIGKEMGVGGSSMLSATSATANDGAGSVQRTESVTTNVAAVVTQVLPNGNLVVEGKQEIRINFEVRELIVAGVVRPEDIAADNTIDSSKIAEARIATAARPDHRRAAAPLRAADRRYPPAVLIERAASRCLFGLRPAGGVEPRRRAGRGPVLTGAPVRADS